MSEALSCYQYRQRYSYISRSSLTLSPSQQPFNYQSYLGKILNNGVNPRSSQKTHEKSQSCSLHILTSQNRSGFDQGEKSQETEFQKSNGKILSRQNMKDNSSSQSKPKIELQSSASFETLRQKFDESLISGNECDESEVVQNHDVILQHEAASQNRHQHMQQFSPKSLPLRANLSSYRSGDQHPPIGGSNRSSYMPRKPRSVYSSSFRSLTPQNQHSHLSTSPTNPNKSYICTVTAEDELNKKTSPNNSSTSVSLSCNIDMFSISDSEFESNELRQSKFENIKQKMLEPSTIHSASLPYSSQKLLSRTVNPIIRCSSGQVSALKKVFESKSQHGP